MNLDAVLALLAREPTTCGDLAEVALWLARDEYPDLDVDAYLAELAGMAHEARAYVKGSLEARVAGLCRYLFHELGFRGNTQDYYDPRNSYLNQVMDRRMGIPITLSAVAIAVGNRAGLDVVGVGLPGHFVVKAVEGTKEILFDPFHEGRVLTRLQCAKLVEKASGMSFDPTPDNLRAVPLGFILQRMLCNLKSIYLRAEDFVRGVRAIERLVQLAPKDTGHQRDLGVCLLRAGQPGRAIGHLAAYLVASPKETDRKVVQELLDQARGEVARWN